MGIDCDADYFFASVLLGVLAYQSQSLIPGIIGHTILDIFDYSFWWTRLFGRFKWETIGTTGIDGHFILWLTIFVASVFGFIFSVKKAGTAKPKEVVI